MMPASRSKGASANGTVDTMGLLLAVVVTAASVSDPRGARRLLKRLPGACKKLQRIWVDGTDRGRLLEWVILHCRFRLQPVLRCDDHKGLVVLPRRSRGRTHLCLDDPMSSREARTTKRFPRAARP